MMLLLSGTLLVVYGFLFVQFKDLFWLDQMIMARLRLEYPVRTEAWERQQDRRGLLMMSAGAALLVAWSVTMMLG